MRPLRLCLAKTPSDRQIEESPDVLTVKNRPSPRDETSDGNVTKHRATKFWRGTDVDRGSNLVGIRCGEDDSWLAGIDQQDTWIVDANRTIWRAELARFVEDNGRPMERRNVD